MALTAREFTEAVEAFASTHKLLPTAGEPMLVALSGGADSVALLLVLLDLGIDLQAAHCNFGLRGEESERDMRFVQSLCDAHDVPLHIRRFDVPAYMEEHGVSLEMACRNLRYAWFRELLIDTDCNHIGVAHHADDNIETFFLNAIRGTGITGLAGMQPLNGPIVRPLLCVSRDDIEHYLSERGQTFVTDSSNASNDMKRNRLRNVVLPALYECFPEARATLTKTIGHMRQCNDLYHVGVDAMAKQVMTHGDEATMIDVEQIHDNAMLLYEILKPLEFNRVQTDMMLESVRQQAVGRKFESGRHRVTVGRGVLYLTAAQPRDFSRYPLNLRGSGINNPVALSITSVTDRPFDATLCDGKRAVAFSIDILETSRAELRHWRDGDRFAPFGMGGRTRLLSDFFSDLKLSSHEKDNVWLLEVDGVIVWVLGHRATNHFTVPRQSKHWLLFEWKE